MNLIDSAVDAFLLAFPALLSIVNPLAGAIIFNEVTAGRNHQDRVALARRVGVNSAVVMLISLWGGSYILSFFGISLNALRLAGGLVVAARAYQMLIAPEVHEERKQAEAARASSDFSAGDETDARREDIAGIAFFPLTLPFTTGPGTIAVAVALGTQRPAYGVSLGLFFAGLSLAAIAMALIIWLTYATADRLGTLLGETGRRVVARLAAFILLGIGVQIMLSGAIPVLHQALHG
ncbi:MAG: MarC family protein [Acidiphilium sp.]|nr:MarC family protein [Acidiphilium sp.]MDD4934320.1 MarC family protein [Acidiphilium sp.]